MLITVKGAGVGKINFAIEAAISRQLMALRPCSQLNQGYLYFWLEHMFPTLTRLGQGATVPGIGKPQIAHLRIPIPAKSEQTRIVAKLEELLSDLEAGVAELKAAQAKLARYRQSLLKAAVEGTLTADWRAHHTPAETGAQLLARILTERRARWEDKQRARFAVQGKTPPKNWQAKYPEPVAPDTTELPALPLGWVWASLDAIIDSGPQNGLYLPKERYGSGTPMLRIDDYQIGWHRLIDQLNRVEVDTPTRETYSLRSGDIVVNRVNSMTHVGKSLLIPAEFDGVLFESNMMRFRLSNLVSSAFTTFYLGSDIGRSRLIKNAKWAVNQASINQQDVARTPVPIPPQEEQLEIVKHVKFQLEAYQNLSAAISKLLREASAQRKNLLKAAFSGQLVPQDPADEPASVLLERIRAQRGTSTRMRRRRTAAPARSGT